ncbi:MAG: DUF488 family protein [Chitinispirillaceae bacterium]|nr:DUF488 family protein [Chitinispirillaceae bacterium]
MMYYRRKILLAFFKAFGSRVDKIRLQKLLFLFCQEQEKPAFHFIPYKYGCFSFQANTDLLTLKKMGMVNDSESEWMLKPETNEKVALSEADEKLLAEIESRFSGMDKTELIRYTYTQFPFYAVNSTVLERNLTPSEISVVRKSIARDTAATLFTIGYEGKTLEEFINILLRQNVSLLCDVRKNAFSMKYGFSKGTLKTACDNAKIRYIHFPGLGIESAQRKDLATKADYTELFETYKKTVLVQTTDLQQEVCRYIQKAGRAALMCFEADPSMCHRSRLAEALLPPLSSSNIPLVHL